MTPETTESPPWKDIPAAGPLLRPAAAAEYLGFSDKHFYAMVAQGLLPPLIKIGLRASAMPRPWLDAFIAHRAEMSL